jgi:GTP-binding protein
MKNFVKDISFVKYVGSFVETEKCPATGLPEFAFIGRSNVGKSSLINYLCQEKELAHTSAKPGKTQTINFFLAESSWYLVDLPGYGYARISKTTREDWKGMINHYLAHRETLFCTFVLIDASIPPQPKDIAFVNWMGEIQIPFVIVFTKMDKKSKDGKPPAHIADFLSSLSETWATAPQHFETSSVQEFGRKEIVNFIHNCLENDK